MEDKTASDISLRTWAPLQLDAKNRREKMREQDHDYALAVAGLEE